MLGSWDFVDPHLARKHTQIHEEIAGFQQKRKQITSNSKLSKHAKQKLLKFNDDCLRDLQSLLSTHKEGMVEYFDEQVRVLTQAEVKKRNMIGSAQTISTRLPEDKSEELTKLEIDGETSVNISNFLNKTRQINEGPQDLSGDNLKTTQRRNRVTSFQLSQYPENTVRKTCPSRPTTLKIALKRAKKQKKKAQIQLAIQRLKSDALMTEIQQLVEQSEQDNELISLLRHKASIVEQQHKRQLQEQRASLESQFKQEMEKICLKYKELERVQKDNQQLEFDRKAAMKALESYRASKASK